MSQTSKILLLSKASSDNGGLFFSRFAPALRVQSNAAQKQKQLAYKRLHTIGGMRRAHVEAGPERSERKRAKREKKSPAVAICNAACRKWMCHLASCEVNRNALTLEPTGVRSAGTLTLKSAGLCFENTS
jgi:hypothetical protein